MVHKLQRRTAQESIVKRAARYLTFHQKPQELLAEHEFLRSKKHIQALKAAGSKIGEVRKTIVKNAATKNPP